MIAFVLGSVLGLLGCQNGPPGSKSFQGQGPGWRSKMALGSSWCGSFFVLPFGAAFLALLGSSWGRFGSLGALVGTVLDSLRLVFGYFG